MLITLGTDHEQQDTGPAGVEPQSGLVDTLYVHKGVAI